MRFCSSTTPRVPPPHRRSHNRVPRILVLPIAMLALATASTAQPAVAPAALPPTIGPGGNAAQPLPPAEILTKLMLTITGDSPTPAAKQAFIAACGPNGPSDQEQFLRVYGERVDQLLAAPGFARTVDAYHAVWWHLPAGDSTALAGMVVSQDRPYSEVLHRDYIYTNGSNAELYSSLDARTATPLPSGGDPYQMIRLADAETRFRSVLSQPDFLMQFPNTATNHNRKRSNYVFRTFLCEDLVNVSLPGVPTPDPGPHGTDADCKGCHTRLDPMARFFDRWAPPLGAGGLPVFDPDQTAAGTIILKSPTGPAQLTFGKTETELGNLLTTLPQAKRCVVRKIWEFAMGLGTPLDAATETDLLATYERTQRFKPTLRQALLHPYFWSTRTPPPASYQRIKPMLQVCAGCHSATQEPHIDLDHYPWRSEHADNVALLHRIYGALSSNPDFPRMPPAPQPTLSSESVSQIKAWIIGGALDDHLQPTLSPSEITEVLND